MNEHSLIYMTKLYEEAMDLNTKLQEEIENLKSTNEEHRVLNGKLREENKRLNNIINELEKDLIEYFKKEYPDRKLEDYKLENCTYDYALVILGKLQELKGSDKE